jgi:hypothetical protein
MAALKCVDKIKDSASAEEVLNEIASFAGLSLQSPSTHDFDHFVKVRKIFCVAKFDFSKHSCDCVTNFNS